MELLFMKGELDAALRATMQKLLDDVQRWDPSQLLTQSESEIAAHLAEKHTVHCPELRRDQMYADEPADVKQQVRAYSERMVEVPATRVVVHVPYDGERDFFFLKPSTYSMNPPRADVTETEVVLTFEDRQLDGERIRGQLEHELAEIERWLAWSRKAGEQHNASLLDTALSTIRQRREKLLRDLPCV